MPRFQRTLENKLVAMAIADVYTGRDRIIHNPYQSQPTADDGVVTGPNYTVADFQLTDDTLSVNRRAHKAEHIDKIEMLQARYDLAMSRADRHAYAVKNKIDAFVFETAVTVAGATVAGAELVGGAANAAITLSDANIDNLLNGVRETLLTNNAEVDRGLFVAMSPKNFTSLSEYLQTNGFAVSDDTIRNGFQTHALGFDIYVTNNLYNDGTDDYIVAGVKGSIQLALPRDGGEFEKKSVSGKFGKEVVTSQVYNATIWENCKPEVLAIKVAS